MLCILHLYTTMADKSIVFTMVCVFFLSYIKFCGSKNAPILIFSVVFKSIVKTKKNPRNVNFYANSIFNKIDIIFLVSLQTNNHRHENFSLNVHNTFFHFKIF